MKPKVKHNSDENSLNPCLTDTPLAESGEPTVPEHEVWLFKNPVALASVQEGLRQSARGEGEIMDFSQYADLEIED